MCVKRLRAPKGGPGKREEEESALKPQGMDFGVEISLGLHTKKGDCIYKLPR